MARESVTITGLDDIVRRLKALGTEASKRGGPVRAAVRKAAVVIQKEEQANIRKIIAEPNIGADISSGLLEESVKPVRAKTPRRYKGETYFVLIPKRRRYPISARTPSGIGVATVGAMLEYGTSKRRAMPWARPAFHAKKGEAVEVMRDETLKGIARLERKLARQ